MCWLTSQVLISQTLILKVSSYIKDYSCCLHFNYCYLKLLISQSKFSGTRKFTFEISVGLDILKQIFWDQKIYFEISVVLDELQILSYQEL